MPRRPCLDCGTLTSNPSRCDTHQALWNRKRDQQRGSATARGYGSAWQRTANRVLAQHRAVYGDWCPGWQCEAHPARDLTVDHIVPRSRGGSDTRENLAVLCRSCNGAKRDR